jgi:hypothetical protein
MFYDDIPVQGFIGEKTTEVVNGRNVTLYSLFTNYIFTIGHNGEEVLEIQWDHDPSSNLDISDTTDPTDGERAALLAQKYLLTSTKVLAY